MGISDKWWYLSGHSGFSAGNVTHVQRRPDLDNKLIKDFKVKDVYSGIVDLSGTEYYVIYGKAVSQIGDASPGSLVWTVDSNY